MSFCNCLAISSNFIIKQLVQDVKQVLDWLQNHGEVFLRKNVGIGRNLQKAKAYQKSHETFEGVVQVSTVGWQTMNFILFYEMRCHFILLKYQYRIRTQMPKSCWLLRQNWLRPANAMRMTSTRWLINSVNYYQEPCTYDVRKILGILDTPLPLVRISRNLSVLFVRKIEQWQGLVL